MVEPRSPTDEDKPTHEGVKELFIEFCIREWEEPNFSESISVKTLEDMSMLDSSALEDLEPGAPLYSGPDLYSALQREVSSKGREKWMRQYNASALQDEKFRNDVGARFDEELKSAGLPNMTGLWIGMKEKVSSRVNIP